MFNKDNIYTLSLSEEEREKLKEKGFLFRNGFALGVCYVKDHNNLKFHQRISMEVDLNGEYFDYIGLPEDVISLGDGEAAIMGDKNVYIMTKSYYKKEILPKIESSVTCGDSFYDPTRNWSDHEMDVFL